MFKLGLILGSWACLLSALPSYGECTITDEDVIQFIRKDTPSLTFAQAQKLVTYFKESDHFSDATLANRVLANPYGYLKTWNESSVVPEISVAVGNSDWSQHDRTFLILLAYRFGLGCAESMAETDNIDFSYFLFKGYDAIHSHSDIDIRGMRIMVFFLYHCECEDGGLGRCQVMDKPDLEKTEALKHISDDHRRTEEDQDKKPIEWKEESESQGFFWGLVEKAKSLF